MYNQRSQRRTDLRAQVARPQPLLAVVLLADVQGAEHDGVRIVELAGTVSDGTQHIERLQQLLRLGAHRILDGRQQALGGGAGLGLFAGISKVNGRPIVCTPRHSHGGGDFARAGLNEGHHLPPPALLLANRFVGGEPMRALQYIKSGAKGGFLFRARRRGGAG